jgi:ribosomal protein S18 acetylase RimI-like enzyme
LRPSHALAEPRRRTPLTVAARAREVAAQEGLRSLAMQVAAALGYRRLVLFERPVDGTPAANPLGLEVGYLEPGAVGEYEALRPGEGETARRRWAEGDRCIASWLDGRLVSVRWLATGSAPFEYLGVRLPLADDEFYLYDTHVDPSCRGSAIANHAMRLFYARLAAEGFHVGLCACLPENRPAWRSLEKSTFERAGRIAVLRIGRLHRTFVRRRPPQAQSSRSTA